MDVEVSLGLPDRLRVQAAELYLQAFRRKLEPFLGSGKQTIEALQKDFDADLGIAAVSEGRLVGLAALQCGRRGFFGLRLATAVREFGWLAGPLRCLVCRFMFSGPDRQGEVWVQALAVAEAMRGMGIGTRLLEAVDDYARERSLVRIGLDVVDTNPRARKLYERLGFRETTTHHYPFLGFLGFSAVTVMIKRVG